MKHVNVRVGSRVVALAAATGSIVVGSVPAAASARTPPSVHMPSGPFLDQQKISISVGPNHYFTPYSSVNILECADPGGSVAHLPKTAATCDGNTIQGDTILINKNGSFSEHSFTVYALPNKVLGEPSHNQPVCDKKKACVLYIGQNQENFTAPKLFSHSFTVNPSRRRS